MPEFQPLAFTASDTLALAMVAVLSFALGMIVTILFTMVRTGSSTPEVDSDLFEEEEEESSPNVQAGDPPPPPKEPWEQDPDWWKGKE